LLLLSFTLSLQKKNIMAEFIQWKVVGPSDHGIRTKTYDRLKSAKVDYGKACKIVDEDGEGKAILYARTTLTGEWICIQELEFEEEDDDDDDDDGE
jgi:hypothetical protein